MKSLWVSPSPGTRTSGDTVAPDAILQQGLPLQQGLLLQQGLPLQQGLLLQQGLPLQQGLLLQQGLPLQQGLLLQQGPASLAFFSPFFFRRITRL